MAGDIDMTSAPVLRDTLSSLVVRYQAQRRPVMDVHPAPTSVQLDLSAVTFFSRAGFDVLLTFGERLTGELTLTGLSRPVLRLLNALPPPVLPKESCTMLTATDVAERTAA